MMIITIFLFIWWLKNIIIGSDFNFYYWYKYKQLYIKWYSDRETFRTYIKK